MPVQVLAVFNADVVKVSFSFMSIRAWSVRFLLLSVILKDEKVNIGYCLDKVAFHSNIGWSFEEKRFYGILLLTDSSTAHRMAKM